MNFNCHDHFALQPIFMYLLQTGFHVPASNKFYNLCSSQKVCEALSFLLGNIYIRFGSKLYRQIVGIPMGTNCAPLEADLFLFCYERDFVPFRG